MGDWMAKLRTIEDTRGVPTWPANATADLEMVAYENGGDGDAVHPHRVVQICDSETRQLKPCGETGEVVVTTLAPEACTMIRFGTGNSVCALEQADDGTVTRLSMLQGRVGDAIKLREISVFPRAVEKVVIAAGQERTQAIAAREKTGISSAYWAFCEKAALRSGPR